MRHPYTVYLDDAIPAEKATIGFIESSPLRRQDLLRNMMISAASAGRSFPDIFAAMPAVAETPVPSVEEAPKARHTTKAQPATREARPAVETVPASPPVVAEKVEPSQVQESPPPMEAPAQPQAQSKPRYGSIFEDE